jgi:hypothetical protein
MQDSKTLINQAAQEIAQSSTTSPTEAGPDKSRSHNRAKANDAHIDALNEVFALLRINYHNQYYKAYSDTQVLNQIKRLWLDSLARFEPETLRRGVKRVIENSEFLPTLHTMIRHCESESSEGLPDAHSAYVEACHAPSPKTAAKWSHPAVYYAGRDSDWFFLNSSSENSAYPIFQRHYKKYCERVIAGETLTPPDTPALPEKIEVPLSSEENLERLAALRKELDL